MSPRRSNIGARLLRLGGPAMEVGSEAERRGRRLRVVRAAGMVVLLLLLGTLGYHGLTGGRYDPLTCLYMTMLTVSTVGFHEVIPVDTEALKVFTIGLILFGGGTLLYFLTSLTALFIEGDLFYQMWRRRMLKRIHKISGHVVVAGAGGIGTQAIRELSSAGRPLVAVEVDPVQVQHLLSDLDESLPHITGDALDDTVLRCAGLERASGLIAALREDRDNLFLCLSARQINPDLRIVTRIQEATSADKFRRIGVDAVVSTALIGGRRLASEMVHPEVTSFLDTLGSSDNTDLSLAEFVVGEHSELSGRALGEARLRDLTNCLVLAVREHAGAPFSYNPGPSQILSTGTRVIALGSPAELDRLRLALGG